MFIMILHLSFNVIKSSSNHHIELLLGLMFLSLMGAILLKSNVLLFIYPL